MKSGYSFLLQHTNLRLYNRIADIISFLNLLFFFYRSFFNDTIAGTGKYRIFAAVVMLSFVIGRMNRKNKSVLRYYFLFSYLLLFAGWVFLFANIWIAMLHLLLAVLDVLARKDMYLHINDDALTQAHGLFKKKYRWDTFSNIILKDELLTLDFKNNKIRYIEINEPVNEAEFNAFCKERLSNYSIH